MNVSVSHEGTPASGRGARRVAVTGASGAIGGHVVRLLASDPANHIVAVRRSAPEVPYPPNVTAAIADYMDPDGLAAAFDGVEGLVFVSSDGPIAQVILHHDNVIRAAANAGVSHIVALSGLDADPDSPFCYAVSYSYTERLLRDSGCPFTVARASVYSEFYLAVLAQARKGEELRVPAGEGRVSLVSRLDVARCIVALLKLPPDGARYEITGPEALDVPVIAGQLTRHVGAPLRFAAVTPEEYRADLERGGESAWWTYVYGTFFESIREQRWAAVGDTVQRLTGRSPAPLQSALAGTAAWGAQR